MIEANFDSWFAKLAGSAAVPHNWQRELGTAHDVRNHLIRIPTGMGKTLGVLAAWSWHRLHRGDDAWPRRSVGRVHPGSRPRTAGRKKGQHD